MKQTKKVLLAFLIAAAACGPTGGQVLATGEKPAKPPATVDSGTNTLPSINTNGSGQGSSVQCPGGQIPQCDRVNENYNCYCPLAASDSGVNYPQPDQTVLPLPAPDASPMPTTPPVPAPDVAPTPAVLHRDAGIMPTFPVFNPVATPDAAPIITPTVATKPLPPAQPDAYVPVIVFPTFPTFPTFPKPETPDALIAASPDTRPTPDTKMPKDTKPPVRLDCGCVEEPTPPVIVPDASAPDTTPIALVPDAGIDTPPDLMPDTTPDLTPDTRPRPDTACTSAVSITITSKQLVCGTEIDWTVVGCTPMGVKVLWSLNPGPTYPNRVGDHYYYEGNPATRSHEIHVTDGPGTYYVRVCEYIGGACSDVYSNELAIMMTH